MTARRFCFTVNNPDHYVDHTPTLSDFGPRAKYVVYQMEIGDSGTYHWQGYVEYDQPVRRTYPSKQSVLKHAHILVANGSHDANYRYCTDPSKRIAGPWVLGEVPQPGKRKDTEEFTALVLSGATELEIAETCTISYLRYFRGIQRLRSLKISPRDFKTEVWICIGLTGTGKSQYARTFDPACWKQASKWWDNYDPLVHETVVLDDFYGWLPFHELLRLGDRYPTMVESKNGQLVFRAKRIIITSNKPPTKWYKDEQYWDSLYRRVEKFMVFQEEKVTIFKNHLLFKQFVEDNLYLSF